MLGAIVSKSIETLAGYVDIPNGIPNFIENEFHRKLYAARILSILMPIDSEIARWIVFGIKELNRDKQGDITIYVNSPGGLLFEAWKVVRAITDSKCDVATVNIGTASGMAAFVLMNGKPGKRFALNNTSVTLPCVEGNGDENDYDAWKELEKSARTILGVTTGQFHSMMYENLTYNDIMQVKRRIVDRVIKKGA